MLQLVLSIKSPISGTMIDSDMKDVAHIQVLGQPLTTDGLARKTMHSGCPSLKSEYQKG